jgi:hypothetical protein
MLSLLNEAEPSTNGLSDAMPIVLQDMKSIDFERMLWMFYNGLVLQSFYTQNVCPSGGTENIPTMQRNGLLSYHLPTCGSSKTWVKLHSKLTLNS